MVSPMSQVSQSVQCLTMDWAAGVRTPTEVEDFSSNLCLALGPTQPPIQWVAGSSFPRDKARPERDADHSPPSSADVKEE
jgi:hypothetical protein